MQLFHGDCLDILPTLPDASVDAVVTSPPYDNLRTYNGNAVFDFHGTANELARIVRVGGVVVWVVADETKQFRESLTSFKQVIYFVEQCGFNLLDTMIYFKQNYAPAYPSLRRYANQFEYMFVFSKGRPNTFNPVQSSKKPYKSSKSTFRQRNGTLKAKTVLSLRDTKDASNVWSYSVTNNKTGHPAVFPLQLATDHILTWTSKGETILDCFLGSGTTGVACVNTGREFIGIERDATYYDIACKRITAAQAAPKQMECV